MNPADNWYYDDGANSVGPFSAARLRELRVIGVITDATLVCPGGGEHWLSLVEALGGFSPETGNPVSTEGPTPGPAANTTRPRTRRVGGRRLVVFTLAALLMALAILGVVRFQGRHGADPAGAERIVKRMPSRADFALALASVSLAADNQGNLTLQDRWGQRLVVKVEVHSPSGQEDGKVAIPASYTLSTRANQTDTTFSGYGNDPAPRKTDRFGVFVILDNRGEIELSKGDNRELAEAVDTLVEWSILAAENRVSEVRRRVSGTEAERYTFHADLGLKSFNLILETRDNDLQSLNRTGVSGHDAPITDYHRAHLWKYLLAHPDEIARLADAHLAAARELAVKAQGKEADRASAQQQELKGKQDAEKAATDRLERIFARPSLTPSPDAAIHPAVTPAVVEPPAPSAGSVQSLPTPARKVDAPGPSVAVREPDAPSPSAEDTPAPRPDPARPDPPRQPVKRTTFYLLEYASARTSKGVYGFEPGCEVRMVGPGKRPGTVIVTDGQCPLEIASALLTDDPVAAAAVSSRDRAEQLRAGAERDRREAAGNAAQQRLLMEHANSLEAVERQRRQDSGIGGRVTPLNQSP